MPIGLIFKYIECYMKEETRVFEMIVQGLEESK